MTDHQKGILKILGLTNALVWCALVLASLYAWNWRPHEDYLSSPITSIPRTGALGPQSAALGKVRLGFIAQGKVVPVRHAALAFPAGGTVTEIKVKLGDRVSAGQVLAQLDARQLDLQLAQAEANLAAAQAAADSAAAQADANVATAQAKYDQLKRGPREEDLRAARQAVKSAQAAYDSLLKPTDSELIFLKAEMEKTKAQVDRAQAAYDRIGGDSNSASGTTQERAALQMAWVDYQKAVALHNSKIHPTDAQVQQAVSVLQTAKDNLAKLSPTSDDLAIANANLNAAKAASDHLPGNAYVRAARAARDIAAEELNRAKLTAPFTGTVVSLDLRIGEQVSARVPVVNIADMTNLSIETTEVSEIDVVDVTEGDSATVTFDAIPDLELNGTVGSIKSLGEVSRGEPLYTVVVKLNQQDPRLRWNMTTKVNFGPK